MGCGGRAVIASQGCDGLRGWGGGGGCSARRPRVLASHLGSGAGPGQRTGRVWVATRMETPIVAPT